jgi:hypothetical protein
MSLRGRYAAFHDEAISVLQSTVKSATRGDCFAKSARNDMKSVSHKYDHNFLSATVASCAIHLPGALF